MNFDPCNCLLKIWESIGTPIPKMGVHLGVWGFIPSHSFALMGQNITKIRIFLLEILVKKDPLLTSLKKILSHFGQVILNLYILIVPCSFLPTLS
jgi:hypothetical protein